ncbi:MAG: hypothetical protein LBD72_02650, partial [Puniceicoccales bacterium]|nr:hypothetical protein [Puniceicoccales bacterium]
MSIPFDMLLRKTLSQPRTLDQPTDPYGVLLQLFGNERLANLMQVNIRRFVSIYGTTEEQTLYMNFISNPNFELAWRLLRAFVECCGRAARSGGMSQKDLAICTRILSQLSLEFARSTTVTDPNLACRVAAARNHVARAILYRHLGMTVKCLDGATCGRRAVYTVGQCGTLLMAFYKNGLRYTEWYVIGNDGSESSNRTDAVSGQHESTNDSNPEDDTGRDPVPNFFNDGPAKTTNETQDDFTLEGSEEWEDTGEGHVAGAAVIGKTSEEQAEGSDKLEDDPEQADVSATTTGDPDSDHAEIIAESQNDSEPKDTEAGLVTDVVIDKMHKEQADDSNELKDDLEQADVSAPTTVDFLDSDHAEITDESQDDSKLKDGENDDVIAHKEQVDDSSELKDDLEQDDVSAHTTVDFLDSDPTEIIAESQDDSEPEDAEEWEDTGEGHVAGAAVIGKTSEEQAEGSDKLKDDLEQDDVSAITTVDPDSDQAEIIAESQDDSRPKNINEDLIPVEIGQVGQRLPDAQPPGALGEPIPGLDFFVSSESAVANVVNINVATEHEDGEKPTGDESQNGSEPEDAEEGLVPDIVI